MWAQTDLWRCRQEHKASEQAGTRQHAFAPAPDTFLLVDDIEGD